jgi:hypothetical protein
LKSGPATEEKLLVTGGYWFRYMTGFLVREAMYELKLLSGFFDLITIGSSARVHNAKDILCRNIMCRIRDGDTKLRGFTRDWQRTKA